MWTKLISSRQYDRRTDGLGTHVRSVNSLFSATFLSPICRYRVAPSELSTPIQYLCRTRRRGSSRNLDGMREPQR